MRLSSDKERELIKKAKRGRLAVVNSLEDSADVIEEGNKALNELWKSYEGAIRGYISNRLFTIQRNNDLKDLVNETASEVVEKIHTYDPDKSKFYTWIRIWARYVLLRYFRKHNQRLEVEILESELEVTVSEIEQDVEEIIEPPVAVYKDTPDEVYDKFKVKSAHQ